MICVGIVYILQMDTLIYIVNHALTIVITAAVVVFQPELRKVLEQLGEKRFISSILPLDNMRSVQELFSDKTINELVKGTVEMAKVKTGALIVMSRMRRWKSMSARHQGGRASDTLDRVLPLSMTERLLCGETGSRRPPVICRCPTI